MLDLNWIEVLQLDPVSLSLGLQSSVAIELTLENLLCDLPRPRLAEVARLYGVALPEKSREEQVTHLLNTLLVAGCFIPVNLSGSRYTPRFAATSSERARIRLFWVTKWREASSGNGFQRV